jgi:threonine/homoserine/homoserine lactone efflux protein
MSVEFLLTSFVVAAIPGTGVVYTIASSIGGGWRRGLFATIGCTLGVVFMFATFVVFAGYAYASAVMRNLVLSVPAVRRWLHRCLGSVLVGFAARLAIADR